MLVYAWINVTMWEIGQKKVSTRYYLDFEFIARRKTNMAEKSTMKIIVTNNMALVTDQVPDIRFLGTQNQLKNGV